MRTYADSVVNKFATDTTGNAGAGALITVYVAGSTVKAPLFDVLGAAITNPLAADDEGNYSFKVADGIYDLVINEGALSETRIDRLQIAEIVGFNTDNAHYSDLASAQAANLDVGTIITTAGYYAANDGGGGDYIVVTGGTGPIDGGSYLNMLNGNQLELIPAGQVKLLQFGAIGDGATLNTVQIQSAFNFANTAGVPVAIGRGVFLSGAITITTVNPFTIIGTNEESSVLLFSGTDGLTVNQSNGSNFISITGLSIKTNTLDVGTGLTIDGGAQVVAGLIQPRTTKRGSIRDIFIGGEGLDSAFENCIDFIDFGWWDMQALETRGHVPANDVTTPVIGTGVLIRGEGNPVEMFIDGWWGYRHGTGLRTPDKMEGLFVDTFNLVAVRDGMTMGVPDSDTLGASAPSTLGFNITNGHINARGQHISFGDFANQNKLSSVLMYVREATYTTGSTIGLELNAGGQNSVSDTSFIIIDDLVSRTSFTPIDLSGQNGGVFNNINISLGVSSQVESMINSTACSRCSFSNITAGAGAGGTMESFFKVDDTTINCTFTAALFHELTVGMVDISGVATKNTEDQNTYNIEYNYTGTVTLAGGAAQEVASITLPSWFLASTTDDVTIGISSILGGQMLLASYEEGTSTTTDIKFRVGTNSGGAITAGDIRVNVLVRPN